MFKINHYSTLLINQSSATLFSLLPLFVSYSFLSPLFKAGWSQSKVTFLSTDLGIKCLSKGHFGRTVASRLTLPGLTIQSVSNCSVSDLLTDFSADTLSFKIFFKSFNAVVHFVLGILEFLLSNLVVLFSLGKVELKLGCFTLSFDVHIDFPVLDTLCKPFFHKSSVSLKFVYLNSPHFLLFHSVFNNIVVIGFSGLSSLALHLLLILLLVEFKVNVLLRSV